MKKFLAILMTTVLCFGMPFYAFAANVSAAEEQENLADGEFIIHQDDDITITSIPASMVDEESLAARATTYESVWLDKSSEGNFKIKTSLRGTIGVTFKVESSSNNSSVLSFNSLYLLFILFNDFSCSLIVFSLSVIILSFSSIILIISSY